MVRIVAGLLVAASLSVPVRAQAPDGAELFRGRCANCHTGEPDTRAPGPDALRARTPQAVIESLVNGAMRVQGAQMSGRERRAVAEYATGKTVDGDVAGVGTGRCATAGRSGTLELSMGAVEPTITNTRFSAMTRLV